MDNKQSAIRDWLKALAVLCASGPNKNELLGKLNAYVPMLAQEFPKEAFSPISLAEVGRKFTFFPSYAELTQALSPWWKEHRPPPVASVITSDQNATVRQREIDREVRESWQTITDADVRAKIRAVLDSPMPQSFGPFLAAALRKHAPQHLPLLPPQWLKERTEPADVIALRRSASFHDA